MSKATTKAFRFSKAFVVGFVFLVAGVVSVNGATFYSRQIGNWSAAATWSATSGGGAGTTIPGASDNVVIERGYTVTVNITDATCANITLGGNRTGNGSRTGTLTFAASGSPVLAVTGTVQVGASTNSNSNGTITFTSGSALQAGNVILGIAGGANGTVTMTNGGTIVTGSLRSNTVNDVFTEGTGTVQLNSTNTLASSDTGAEFVTFNNLIIASGTTTLARATSISGNLTVNNGAALNTGNFQLSLGGNFSNSGTFTAGSSPIVIINATATQSIDGFTTTGLVSMTKSGGIATFQGNVNAAGLTINGNGGTLNLGIGLTHTFTGIVTLTAGSLNGGSSVLNENATSATAWNGTGTLFTAGTGTVNFGGVGQTLATATTFNNLTFSNSGTKTLNGVPTVNGILSMEGTATVSATPTYGSAATLQYKGSALQTTGNEFPTTFNGTGGVIIDNSNGVTLGAARTIGTTSKLILTTGVLTTTATNLLSITNTATTAITGGSTAAYISGPVKWTLPASLVSGSAYNFPVGKAAYLPFSLVNPITGTGAVTAQVEAFSTSSGGTYDATLGAISTSEYWSLATSGNFTNSSVSASRQTAISPLNAIAASTTLTGVYSTLGGSIGANGISASNSIGTSRYFVFGQAIPIVSASLTTLTGFTYPFGTGPSTQQTFTVSGNSLTENVVIVPSTNYEISKTTGSGFQSTSISLPISNGTLSSTTIYVRLKAGLSINTYNSEIISLTSAGASTKSVSCSGSVTTAPAIVVNPISRTGFAYTYNSATSTSQSFTVSGTNLVDNVIVTPPANYEISTGSTYQSTPISLTPTSGTLSSTTINVRLRLGLGVGSYNETVTASATGATTQNVSLSGTVNPGPTIYNNTSLFSGFIYSGSGPSGYQTFQVSGTNLSAALVLTPQANYEISLSPGSGYVSTTSGTPYLSIAPTGGTVALTTIYVRLKAGLAVGNYNLVNVVITSTGAITKSVTCSGSVVSGATTVSSKTTLDNFGYLLGSGPSSTQYFTVSGAVLGANNITITPATNYEISTSNTSFVATNPITLTPTSGAVAPTNIYVRLKGGLTSATYNSEVINIACAATTTKTVTCSGRVFANPLIQASVVSSPSCPGSSISLVGTGSSAYQYWTGPNSFYSTSLTAALATNNATPSMSGTYTITGNVIVGGNLIANGNFELGNAAFASGYGTPAIPYTTSSLVPEGLYAITTSGSVVHTNFSTNGDHATGTGLQMVINGNTNAGVVVWSQTVQVIQGASYQFTYWVHSVVKPSDTNPSRLQLYVNGVAAGPVYTADQSISIWTQFLYNTSAGTNTVLNLELVNQNTIAGGNDFALDDIEFQQILSSASSVDVLVNSNLPASVSVTSTATSVVQGATVSYTATPTNGGDTPTYQWKVNGVNKGTNSSVFSYVPANGDLVTCTMTSSLACGNSATSNTITMTVTQPANYWRGTNGTDWGTASNWTAGFVPAPGENVIYASTTNSYGSDAINDLVLDQNRTIGSLINATTQRLVIPAAKGLTVNNTITTDNNPNRIYIHCDSLTSNGSLIFHNSPASPVYATVEMYSKASWNLSNPVSSDKYHWQYFGIPLQSVVAEPTFNGSYVRKWYETGTAINNHWIQLNNYSTLVPFYGYELCQSKPKVFYFQGALVNNDFNSGQLAFTYYGSGDSRNALYPGQHVFANPYTTAIDIRQLVFGSQTEASVYMYNTGTFNSWTNGGQTSPGQNPGQYTSSTKNTAGYGGVPRQVPSMGALLVKALSNSAQATFGITYSSVAMVNTDLQRVSSPNQVSADKVFTKIDVSGSNGGDRMWIFSESNCTRDFDNGWDGIKMLGSSLSPQLYARETDGNYQVNVVDDMNNTELDFQSGLDNEYTLTFTHDNVKRYYPGVYLVDKVENKIVDVTESGSQYKFLAVSTPNPVNRFQIVTRYYEKDAADETSEIKIFSSKGMIFVHNFSSHNGTAMIFDISGHFVKKVPFSANGITILNSGIASGAYVAKCLTETEKVTKRIIVR